MSEKNNARVGKLYVPLEGVKAMMAVWALRIMTDLDGCVDATRSTDTRIDLNDNEWRFCGLVPSKKGLQIRTFLTRARARLNSLVMQGDGYAPIFNDNLNRLTSRLGLSGCDADILGFVVHLKTYRILEKFGDRIDNGELNSQTLPRILSIILDLEAKDIRKSLSSRSKLASLGLLKVEKDGIHSFDGAFELMDGLQDVMFEQYDDIYSMLEAYFKPARKNTLNLNDFPHQAKRVNHIRQYLQYTLDEKKSGVNVLIYGPPGTGKTELAMSLGEVCKADCYEVSMMDEDGDELSGTSRFSAFRLAQGVLGEEKRALIIFDEIEDVFGNGGMELMFLFGMRDRTERSGKAWVNRLLETNPVPAIWISNSVHAMDTAYLRRFDFVLELGIPPRKIRKRILRDNLDIDMVSDRWVDAISEYTHISPAMISRASRVVSCLKLEEKAEIENQVQDMLDSWSRCMRLPHVRPGHTEIISYRVDILNTDPPIDNIAESLRRTGSGRLCLYGLPGTGKTAFGRYIAKQLDKPLLIKRASDLLDMYVGNSEKNIAAMFREAEHEDAVLLLDEADSFLRDRQYARASWDITQVNELLTQMESYEGIFICSTNLMDQMDDASLRRFDLKIHFDSLTQVQAWRLFTQILTDQGVEFREATWRKKLNAIQGITPGDFSTVLRTIRVSGQDVSPQALLQGLECETDFRDARGGRGIGFNAEL